MSEALPAFRYHPDPVRSGSVEKSTVSCKCCGCERGFVYVGPVYAEADDLDDALCPWCIADGSAAAKFDAYFNNVGEIADKVPAEVQEEVEKRTPGFITLQEGEWRACCGDAAAYLMRASEKDLLSREFPRSRSALMMQMITEEGIPSAEAGEFVMTLTQDSGHSAYMFRCLKCGKFLLQVEFE
jgi:uncharacterized protein CbrC (UPF0167 family)